MEALDLHIHCLPHQQDLPLPQYKTEGSVGLDLSAAIQKSITLQPGQRALIPTGIEIAIPEGYEGQVRPRSGLALKHGLTLPNAPGTVDSDYRGEIQVILMNSGNQPFVLERGVRIAQLVVAPVVKARLIVVDNLDPTLRGSGGFGHTG